MTNNSDKNRAAPHGLTRWVPGLKVLREYQAAWLPRDVMAGLVLTTMLVPVGIAYATASGVPGIYGLYATIVPLLAYAVFGPSRILVLGPDSSLAAVILAVVAPLVPVAWSVIEPSVTGTFVQVKMRSAPVAAPLEEPFTESVTDSEIEKT